MFVVGKAQDLGQWYIREHGPVICRTCLPEIPKIHKPWFQAPGLAASEIT